MSSLYDQKQVVGNEPFRYSEHGYSQQHLEHMTPQTDGEVIKTALRKLRSFCIVSMFLGCLTFISGATTLGFAAANIGFPVFNFGPLIIGILYFTGGSVGFFGCSKATNAELLQSIKCCVMTVFVVSVTSISLATVSGVFAFLSGAVCGGADIEFYNKHNNVRTKIDVKQYCSPNNTANTVLGFIDGVLCILIAIWSIFGCIFFCVYGKYFGIRSRGRGC